MRRVAFMALTLAALGCTPSSGPQGGSQTNWLVSCETSAECGTLECLCGVCTSSCSGDGACAELPGAACVAPSDPGAVAICGGHAPSSSLCLPPCDESTCAEGQSCVAGVCAPDGDPTARVSIDPSRRAQVLVGFGASLSYAEDDIVEHPQNDALYDLLFAASGLDVIRLRNGYDDDGDDDFIPAAEIVAAATERLGRTPLLFMTSHTPPAALKANGSRTCGGDDATCSLTPLESGSFDYAAFGSYWRTSLGAFAEVGIEPDYISVQNHPNFVPSADDPGDACYFLPQEGTKTVVVEGTSLEVRYPGYREAVAAVRAAIADLPAAPRIAAPEVLNVGSVAEYASPLEGSAYDALALHLYGVDPMAVDDEGLEAVRALAAENELPVFQTEIQAEGLETAILVQHAVTTAGASAYLQNDLVSVSADGAPVALAHLTSDGFEAQLPYYALLHFSKSTDPGFTRIDATSDATDVLVSAWLSPEENALTIILVNAGSDDHRVDLSAPRGLLPGLARAEVARTVFSGSERFVVLGELAISGVVGVPGGSVVTVALSREE